MKVPAIALLIVLHLPVAPLHASPHADGPIQWLAWSEQAFELAKRESKLVLLDLEAVWCHWCHVMEEKTYSDPAVIDEIHEHYVPVRADKDAYPELSNRFEDYGWPATIIFDANGTVILKRRGYIEAQFMFWLLKGVWEDPATAGADTREIEVQPADHPGLTDAQRADIIDRYEWLYDEIHGGWGNVHKFIHAHSLEYALRFARNGSRKHETMVRETLDAAVNLLDPEWGGVYQYSDQLDWKSPHYEKIMSIQTESIRSYALAYQLLLDQKYLHVATTISRFLTELLMSPDGTFYTSQDADLNSAVNGRAFYTLNRTERRKLGMPRIDKNIYTRDNGWAISAFAAMYAATGDDRYLFTAERAATWIITHHSISNGGFRHHQIGDTPYLGDTVAMGKAFIDLYSVTGDRQWLARAVSAADFIGKTFMDKGGGGFTTRPSGRRYDLLAGTIKHLDSNIEVTRFVNLTHHYTGRQYYRDVANHGMRYISSPAITDQRRFLSGVLVADLELRQQPIHITVVGHKDDIHARTLFKSAIRYPAGYKRVEWWDKREGPLPNPDVRYPELDRAAAFACANRACSLPVFDPLRIASAVDRLYPKTPSP